MTDPKLESLRETCAKVCDELSKEWIRGSQEDAIASGQRLCAMRIRALDLSSGYPHAALRDAERYRWLADKVIAPDYGDNDSDPHQKGYLIRHCKGPEVIYGESIDAAIDVALAEKGKP